MNEVISNFFLMEIENYRTFLQQKQLQHVKHAAYQAGHVWGQALSPNPSLLPSPSESGWQKTPRTGKMQL